MELKSLPEPAVLVDALADPAKRWEAFTDLDALGPDALPAVCDGLRHGNWQVRRWCAIHLDRHADPESLRALVPLLRDPKGKVRLWAVHSISCEHCRDDPNPIDVVPLLIERIEQDESIRVRRMATAMLAVIRPDARAVPVLERLERDEEEEPKLRRHAAAALARYRVAGLGR